MKAKEYWGTSKYLGQKHAKEARAVAEDQKQRDADEFTRQALERLAAKDLNDAKFARMWNEVKPGMRVGTVTVAKKHRYSITSTQGIRYTISELFGSNVERIVRANEKAPAAAGTGCEGQG